MYPRQSVSSPDVGMKSSTNSGEHHPGRRQGRTGAVQRSIQPGNGQLVADEQVVRVLEVSDDQELAGRRAALFSGR